MKVKAQSRPQTIEQARAELSRRLEARRSEIEAAVMTRVYSVSDTKDLDPTYAEGLKTAVTAAVDYGLIAIELGEERTPPPPPILLAQARLAARAGVPLDTVLRRYFAGHALLGDFLIEEAEGGRLLRGAALQRLLRTQAALFDRLLAAVSEELVREEQGHSTSTEQRRAERIERLLAGELLDISDITYDFDGYHVGAITTAPSALEVLGEIGSVLDRHLLAVRLEDGGVWAWLGGRNPIDPSDLQRRLTLSLPNQCCTAIGEPAFGPSGWRQTHHQARAALPVALRGRENLVRYSDVALLASTLQDDLLATSLRQIYLSPLEGERGGGKTLRETLQAYFATDRHVSSTAASLGVSRHTVSNRLHVIERRLGRSLGECASHLEAALRIDELKEPVDAATDLFAH